MFQLLPMDKGKTLSRRERNLVSIRKQAIVVAERIILENGVDALNARGLAKELNISVGSLYNAFGELDAVVHAVVKEFAIMMAAKLHLAIQASANNKRSRIIALGQAYFDFAVEEPQRWQLMFEHKSSVHKYPEDQEYQNDILEMLIQAGDADPNSQKHKQFFLLLWASVHGLVSLACRPNIIAIDPKVARTYIGDLVETGLNIFPID